MGGGAALRRGSAAASPPPCRHHHRRRHLRSPHSRAVVAATAAAVWSVGVVTPVSADDVQQFNFTPRSFDGVGNNEANPEWGAAGTPQVPTGCVLWESVCLFLRSFYIPIQHVVVLLWYVVVDGRLLFSAGWDK